MEMIFYPAAERGHADHGWLKAKHSFSFASWYDPEKVNFGALRVLNDDSVAPGMGFATHPHDNMEIITIPLEGFLKHRDNMGHEGEVLPGEIQIMSAGTGVTHSEFNASHESWLKLFQIWIIPDKRNVEPRYQQFRLNDSDLNGIKLVVGPRDAGAPGWIHQNAYISIADSLTDAVFTYTLYDPSNGVYILEVDGSSEIEGQHLNERDAVGIRDKDEIYINMKENSRLLLLEVPMNL